MLLIRTVEGGEAVRIAIPVAGEAAGAPLGACEAFCFYEDDHGRIVRQFRVPVEGSGLEAALTLLERYGVDVVVCGELSAEEKRALASAGLLLAPGASGRAEEAARAYLGRVIACDPDNTCNYCGHRDECEVHNK